MKPYNVKKSSPSRKALEQTANFINDYEKNSAQMKLSVKPRFSVLKEVDGYWCPDFSGIDCGNIFHLHLKTIA